MKLVSIIKGVLLSVAVMCGGVVMAQTDTNPVKWNPGHYIQLGGGAGDWLVENTFKDVAALKNVQGVQIREQWPALETSKGVYDFRDIDFALNKAQTYNKRVWLFLGTKAFTPGGKAAPSYMYSGEYGQVAYKIAINGKDAMGTEATEGENLALYNDAVRDRLIALLQELGRRYNANDRFEGVAFNETAMGNADPALTVAQKDKWFANLTLVHAAARKAFPNTNVMQFVNFPRSHVAGLAEDMRLNGTALGGPDTFLNAPDLNEVTYPLYDLAYRRTAIGPSVQGENYVAQYQYGPFEKIDPLKIYNFAKTRLHANYIFWNRASMMNSYDPYPRVLAMFKSSTFPQTIAGGLATACPEVYYSCVKTLP